MAAALHDTTYTDIMKTDITDTPTEHTPVTDLVGAATVALLYAASALLVHSPFVDASSLVGEVLSLLRVSFGLLLSLFVSGYVILALLSPRLHGRDDFGRGERAVVSFLLSLALLVVQGLLLNASAYGFRAELIARSTFGFVLFVALLAGIHRVLRSGLPVVVDTERFRAGVDRLRGPPTRVDTVLNVALVVLLIGASAAVALPSVGDETPQFTEFGLLAESDSNGLVATNVSSALRSDESRLVVRVTNREHATRQYSVVVQVQRAVVRNRSVEVLQRRRIDTSRTALAHNESASLPYRFDTAAGRSGCRVAFLLYKGEPPQSPTVANAYRELHLWDGATPSTRAGACPSMSAISTS